MFYSHILLTKKGPLAKVWLAAHWDRKITKAQVFETNLCQSVDAIIRPQVRLSLRTSGHLLLGVVKLHSRKARYLLSDCNETLVGIKMAFRPEAVVVELGACLPSTVTMPQIDLREAALLMEGYHLIDLEINYDDQMMFQARHEDITLREEAIGDFSTNMIIDDFGYGNDEIMDVTGVDNIESFGAPSLRVGDDSRRSNATQKKCILPIENETEAGVNSPYEFENDVSRNINDTTNLFNIPMTPAPPMIEDVEMMDVSQVDKPEDESVVAKTKDALVLQPIDAAQIGTIRKARRRRRLLVDDDKCLTSEIMRDHFNDRADIITELDLAPPTKDLMNWREFTCEKMMEMPVRFMKSKMLLQAFKSGLNLKSGNKNEARDKKAAKAVSDILNEPLIIANDDSDSQNQPRPPSPSDSAEIARLSMAGANTETNLSRDVIDEPMATEQSHIFDITGDQPSFALDFEKQLSSSAAKENRNANLSFPANESTTTPIKRNILRPSARANVTPESPKMTSRVRKFEEPLSRKLFTQGLATPKSNRYASGDDSFVLPPLDPQTPGGCETPRRNTAFDVTSTYSPIGTVNDHLQQEEANVEVEPVRREDRIKELFQVIYVELKAINFTFKDALKQLESKSGKTMSRKRAASTFHALLELKKRGQIKVDQSTPFGDIRVVAIGD